MSLASSDALDAGEIASMLKALIKMPAATVEAEWAAYCDSRSMENYAFRLCEILKLTVSRGCRPAPV